MIYKIFHTADWKYNLNKKQPFDYELNAYLKDVKTHTDKFEQYEDVLQIIVGDIFENIHDLVKIDEFLAVKDMLTKMTELSPVVMVGGNHDNKKDNAIDANDNLLKIVNNWDIYGLTYIKHSEVYETQNVRLINYSIYNQSKPPKDYNQYLNGDKFNIGLYHDPLNCAIDYGGKTFKTSPSLKIFDGLDAVMMGDIHKRQAFEFNKNKFAVYCGSPYQRRVSESINEHGYVLWDLYDKEISFNFVDIDNPFTIVKADYDYDNKTLDIKNKI